MQLYVDHHSTRMFVLFVCSMLAQIPNELIEMANKNSDKSGAWWSTAVAFGALALLVFIGRFGIKAIKAIVLDHKELQKQHIETLKETLTTTQKIASENANLVRRYDEVLHKTTELIEADIEATNENARALKDLESMISQRFK